MRKPLFVYHGDRRSEFADDTAGVQQDPTRMTTVKSRGDRRRFPVPDRAADPQGHGGRPASVQVALLARCDRSSSQIALLEAGRRLLEACGPSLAKLELEGDTPPYHTSGPRQGGLRCLGVQAATTRWNSVCRLRLSGTAHYGLARKVREYFRV
jgi:hypothetical protein